MRFLCALSLIVNLFFCATASASEKITFPINVQGLEYQIVVSENAHLSNKVSGVDVAQTGKHYIGNVKDQEQSWVRASLIDGRWQGVVSIHNAMHMFEHTDTSVVGAESAMAVMESTPMAEVEGLAGTCGSGDGSHGMLDHIGKRAAMAGFSSTSSALLPAPATFAQFCSQEVNGICVIAELEIAFDLVFQSVFGVQANAQALAILNIVDGHYLNDLKISIDAITVEMLANDLFDTSVAASPVLDAGVLLTNIETKKNNAEIPFIKNNSALTHLVTGRDFNGGTLGVAYLGSVCQANGFSTGTSSIFFNNPTTPNIPLTAIVVAHELAHNLGSDHDGPGANVLCPSSTFIMSPVINPAFNLTNFSSCSAADIESTLSNLVNPELCLDFPADVLITENAGNSGALDANLEFLSSYTATLRNGFIAIDRVDITGSINLAEGMFINVTANGNTCVISGGGSGYSCTVMNPPGNFQIIANVRVDPAATNVNITHIINEQTPDVQEVNAANNTLLSMFSVSGGGVTSNTPGTTAPPGASPTPTSNNTDSDEGEGGAGNIGIMIMLLMMMLVLKRYYFLRNN